jgi:hypothetical protein
VSPAVPHAVVEAPLCRGDVAAAEVAGRLRNFPATSFTLGGKEGRSQMSSRGLESRASRYVVTVNRSQYTLANGLEFTRDAIVAAVRAGGDFVALQSDLQPVDVLVSPGLFVRISEQVVKAPSAYDAELEQAEETVDEVLYWGL